MTINLDDYYITVESLANFEDNDINKWINTTKKPKRVERKLKKQSEFGGSFTSNHLNVVSTDFVNIPFLVKNDKKWILQFGKARMVNFFHSLETNLDETRQTDISQVSLEETRENDISRPSLDVSHESNKMAPNTKKRSHVNNSHELKKMAVNTNKISQSNTLDQIIAECSKVPSPSKKIKSEDELKVTESVDTTLHNKIEKKEMKKSKEDELKLTENVDTILHNKIETKEMKKSKEGELKLTENVDTTLHNKIEKKEKKKPKEDELKLTENVDTTLHNKKEKKEKKRSKEAIVSSKITVVEILDDSVDLDASPRVYEICDTQLNETEKSPKKKKKKLTKVTEPVTASILPETNTTAKKGKKKDKK